MFTVRNLAIVITGGVLSVCCLGLEVASAHPGHSPLVPHSDEHSLSTLATGGDRVLIVPPGASNRPTYSVFTGLSTFLAVREDTGGRFSLFDISVSPQKGPPPHIHNEQDEAFYVLDGQVELLEGNQPQIATPGTFFYVPYGRRHQFFNPGISPARLLALTIPSGFEGFFQEEGKLVTDFNNIPPPRTDLSEIAPIAARYDTQLALAPETDLPPGLRDFLFVPPGAPGRQSMAVGSGLLTALATNAETGNQFELFDLLLTPETESIDSELILSTRGATHSFYVLEGEVLFKIGGQTTVGSPGTFVYLPPETPYTLTNQGTTPARTLFLTNNSTSVPEPSASFGLLGLGVCAGLIKMLRYKF